MLRTRTTLVVHSMYKHLATLIKQEVGLDPARIPFLNVSKERRMTNNNLITAAAKKKRTSVIKSGSERGGVT